MKQSDVFGVFFFKINISSMTDKSNNRNIISVITCTCSCFLQCLGWIHVLIVVILNVRDNHINYITLKIRH